MRQWMKIVENTSYLTVYRGEYSGNKGGNFWTENRDFARQFTQSGQDSEIIVRYLNRNDVYTGSEDTYAGDPDAIDEQIAIAREQGYKALLLDEGSGEPKSIYVFDKSALKRSPI